jgi:4-hydroxy-3-methylbut-2-enyl diphosphate reductase
MNQPLEIILAQPRGFCAGVERAIDIVEKAIIKYGPPIYVRHEIVHNRWVVEDLKRKGVIFVKELDEVPDGAITIFSAHGVAEKVELEAKRRDLPAIDATCPLVTKVHNEARRYEDRGHQMILIGHAGHPEVEGTLGRIKGEAHLVATVADVEMLEIDPNKPLSYVTQTTLSVDDTREVVQALKARYPQISGPDVKDICYATQNRQNAVRELAKEVELLLVIGAQNSSNSNRLRDLGEEMGVNSHLINDASEFDAAWLTDEIKRVGITAGASAPELLVEGMIEHLQTLRPTAQVRTLEGLAENVHFRLPAELRDVA